MSSKHLKAAIFSSVLAFSGASQAITIEFDYSLDTSSFFDAGKKAVLGQVASLFGSNLTDSLSAITSFGSNNASFIIDNPAVTGTQNLALTNQSIAADVVRIYLGATTLGTNVLGEGGPGGYSGSGSFGFQSNLATRGELGTTGTHATDFGPWGGTISFSSSTNWYVDNNVASTESFTGFDFYSVAMHEVGHVLGMGIADSWKADTSTTFFVGANAESVKGSPIALTTDLGHWAAGTTSFVNGLSQEAAMSPSIANGQRKYFTQLDWAGLADVGWQVTSFNASPMSVTAVPEPEQYAMLLAGLTMVGWTARRRKALNA